MKIRIKNGLPYISATLTHHSQSVTLKNVLLDTGSAGTIFSTDRVAVIGLPTNRTISFTGFAALAVPSLCLPNGWMN